MKRVALVAAALAPAALIAAPMAQAQDCSTLYSVISSGQQDQFEGIFDDEVDDGIFETTLTFPKADACEVDSFEPYYYCRWDAQTAADADKAIMPLYDMVKVCLSENWAWTDLTGKTSILGAKILEGYSMTKTKGEHKDAVVRLYIAPQDGGVRQVWLEAAPY